MAKQVVFMLEQLQQLLPPPSPNNAAMGEWCLQVVHAAV